MRCVRLIVAGYVQGVSYRYYVKREADRLGVCGYILNKPEGSVEITACGSEDAIEALIRFCRNNPGYSEVSDVAIADIGRAEVFSFTDFEIRR